MKKLLISDTHLGLQKSSDVWHDVTLNLFREVTDLCLSKDINTILHLGDFFHEKKSTNQKTLDVAYEIANITKPLEMIIITGNHDIYYKEVIKPSSLKCFKDTPNINVIAEPTTIDTSSLIPWKGEIPSFRGSFCFGHFEINDFHQNDVSVCRGSDLDAKSFKGFYHVYSGHFHMPSSKGNITYLGSAFQQTFNDVGSSRGYYIFDNGDLEFIEYKSAPKFIKIHTEEEIKNVEGNIVKLIYDKDYGTNENNKILEMVERMGPLRLDPNFTNIVNEDDGGEEYNEEDISIIEHDEIVKKWVKDNKVPENINKKILLRIMQTMLKEEE